MRKETSGNGYDLPEFSHHSMSLAESFDLRGQRQNYRAARHPSTVVCNDENLLLKAVQLKCFRNGKRFQ